MAELFEGVDGTNVVARVEDIVVFTVAETLVHEDWAGPETWHAGRVHVARGTEYSPAQLSTAQARQLAAGLLRAAEGTAQGEAERDLLEFMARAGWDGSAMVRAVVKEAQTRDRERVAAFIRANVNMQGLDFADAEAVADWLEGK